MRLASYNVESLFSRPCALNQPTWAEGKDVLAAYTRLNTILRNEAYGSSDKSDILALVAQLGLNRSDDTPFVVLRQNHGRLLKRYKSRPPEVVANGRNDWVGWLDLKTEAVDEIATRMTAKVISDVAADILVVVEAEDRIALKHFNAQLLKPFKADYSGIMLIDGNDERGIDVGLMTRNGCAIQSVASHVDDMSGKEPVFSRDCAEYTIDAGDKTVLVMANHLKSKGYGSPAQSNARRKAQATRVREIYEKRRSQGIKLIAIAGDFNDTPDSDPLQPLLGSGSDLKDISTHPGFQSDGRPGTFGNGAASSKFDYILLSQELYAIVKSGGLWRKGVWGGKNGDLFEHYDEITEPEQAASDHAAIWAEW